jgi:predicted transcriptional regulator
LIFGWQEKVKEFGRRLEKRRRQQRDGVLDRAIEKKITKTAQKSENAKAGAAEKSAGTHVFSRVFRAFILFGLS